MPTTTHTPTLELADVHRFAGELLARTDLTIHGLHVYPRSIGLMLTDDAYPSLTALYATLDTPAVRLTDHPTEQAPHQVILSVDGEYRGVPTSAQVTVRDTATLDLIRVFTDENGKPNGRLLDVLVSASREG